MSGDDPRDPMSKPRPRQNFREAARVNQKSLRVAFSEDLGITPVDREVRQITREAAEQFQKAGAYVDTTHPDVSDAYSIFQILRAQSYAIGMRDLIRDHRDALKPEVIWNTEKGLALTMKDVVDAEWARTALMQRVATFFERYDVLLCPATIVPPFPVEERAVMSCDGVVFETYVDWLLIVAVATLAGCPALSLPCGFTKAGLPVGLQMIGPANGEAKLLAVAHRLEMILNLKTHKPILPRVTHALS